MHFKPTLERIKQTCARTRLLDISLTVKLDGQKLGKVRSAKFLGVIIIKRHLQLRNSQIWIKMLSGNCKIHRGMVVISNV